MKKYSHFVSYDSISVYVTVMRNEGMDNSPLNLKIAQIMGDPIEVCHQFATYRFPKTLIENAGITVGQWWGVIFSMVDDSNEEYAFFERESFDDLDVTHCQRIANELRDLPFSDDPAIVNCIERLQRGIKINPNMVYNLYIQNQCNLLHTVKAVKNLGVLGLKEAKDLVDRYLCN